MDESIPLKRMASARSSMESVQRSMEFTRQRYRGGKVLKEPLENFRGVSDQITQLFFNLIFPGLNFLNDIIIQNIII